MKRTLLAVLLTLALFVPAQAQTTKHLYIPYAPFYHRPTVFYGSIFGTALCQTDGTPAARATIDFNFLDGGGTSGTANGVGQFVILAVVGKRGRLFWNDTILSGVLTMSVTPQFVTVHIDCVANDSLGFRRARNER